MKNRKIAIIVGIIFVILCVGLYIFIYTIPELTGSLKPTTIVQYGEMCISKKLPAVLVRKEAVHDSQASGNVTYYVSDNTKTRKGTNIMDIYKGGDKTTETCPATGVVSYYYDGYESILNFDTLNIIDTLLPSDGSTIPVLDLKKDIIARDDHIYKLITSDTWYTVIFVPNEELDDFAEGSKVTLKFETGSVSATIDQIVNKENTSLVIVSTTKYFADYDKLRQCEVEVVLHDDKGLIIPNTAISAENGEVGVYVKKIDGSYVFTRIKIINQDNVNSVVVADKFDDISTISIYDEILKNASAKD